MTRLVIGAIVLASVAGCSDGRKAPAALPTARVKPRAVFVVIGGRESSGSGLRDSLHTAWPQIVFADQFPNGTVYVNLARNDTTVADAKVQQTPLAIAQRPTVVAVWLGEGDDDAGTSPVRFGRDLRSLLGQLRRSPTTRVLVGYPPVGAPGSRFAAEIASAARATGSELVRFSSAAWDPHASRGQQVAVQAAAAAELAQVLKH